MKAAFITDEDQFTASKDKEYNLNELVKNNYAKLHLLREGINTGRVNGRINNMTAMSNRQPGIKICSGKKTLEYQICKANVFANKEMTKETWLYELIQQMNPNGMDKVDFYMSGLEDRDMNEDEQQNVALLMWKCLPGKAEFAQTLNSFLLDKNEESGDIKFTLPTYIQRSNKLSDTMSMNYDITPQRQAYIDARGYTILTACPGSGKTTSIVKKLLTVSHFCEEHYGSHTGFVCMSFTNKACDELKYKYQEMHHERLTFPNEVLTIDSFIMQYVVLPFWYLCDACKKKPIVVNEKEILERIYYNKILINGIWQQYPVMALRPIVRYFIERIHL